MDNANSSNEAHKDSAPPHLTSTHDAADDQSQAKGSDLVHSQGNAAKHASENASAEHARANATTEDASAIVASEHASANTTAKQAAQASEDAKAVASEVEAALQMQDEKRKGLEEKMKEIFSGSFGAGDDVLRVPERKKLTGHIFALLGLGFLLLLCGNILYMFESERSYLYSEVADKYTKVWGDIQKLSDPVIAIPAAVPKKCDSDDCTGKYKEYGSGMLIGGAGKAESSIRIDSYNVSEGPFDIGLYKAYVRQKGYIELDINAISFLQEHQLRTNLVYVLIYLSDYRSLEKIHTLKLAGVDRQAVSLSPFTGFAVALSKKEVLDLINSTQRHSAPKLTYEFIYSLRGSNSFTYTPLASQSTMLIAGNGIKPEIRDKSGLLRSNLVHIRGSNIILEDDGTTSLDLSTDKLISSTNILSTSTDKDFGNDARKDGEQSSSAISIGHDEYDSQALKSLFEMAGTSYEMKFSTDNIVSYEYLYQTLFDLYKMDNDEDRYSNHEWQFRNYFNRTNEVELYFSPNYFDTTYELFEAICLYSILMMMIVFVTLLSIEVSIKRMISRLQYFICGLGIIIFYVFLLALAEYMSFFNSYIIAALITSSMLSAYIYSATEAKKAAAILMGVQLVGHALTYVIVFVTGLGLLISTVLLVIMLGVIMFITRKINRQD